jgi:hypothetical protein
MFALDALERSGADASENVAVFEELAAFIQALTEVLDEKPAALDYWRRSNTLKEDYREKVRSGISGVAKEISIADIRFFLEAVVNKVDEGVARARRFDGLFPTYFYYKVTQHELIGDVPPAKEGPFVRPLEFERHDMPLFLEGLVHALRCERDPERAQVLYGRV